MCHKDIKTDPGMKQLNRESKRGRSAIIIIKFADINDADY